MRNAMNWSSYGLDSKRLQRLLPQSLRLRAVEQVLLRNLSHPHRLTTVLAMMPRLMDDVEEEVRYGARKADQVLF